MSIIIIIWFSRVVVRINYAADAYLRDVQGTRGGGAVRDGDVQMLRFQGLRVAEGLGVMLRPVDVGVWLRHATMRRF